MTCYWQYKQGIAVIKNGIVGFIFLGFFFAGNHGEALRGSEDRRVCKKPFLVEENLLVAPYKLEKPGTAKDVEELVARGKFVSIPLRGDTFMIDSVQVKSEYRYALPSMLRFLGDYFPQQYADYFNKRFMIVSLIRSLEHQKDLERRGVSNAERSVSNCESLHPTGATVDISKAGMRSQESYFVYRNLVRLREERKIHFINEMRVFHIVVSPDYPEPFRLFSRGVSYEKSTSLVEARKRDVSKTTFALKKELPKKKKQKIPHKKLPLKGAFLFIAASC